MVPRETSASFGSKNSIQLVLPSISSLERPEPFKLAVHERQSHPIDDYRCASGRFEDDPVPVFRFLKRSLYAPSFVTSPRSHDHLLIAGIISRAPTSTSRTEPSTRLYWRIPKTPSPLSSIFLDVSSYGPIFKIRISSMSAGRILLAVSNI